MYMVGPNLDGHGFAVTFHNEIKRSIVIVVGKLLVSFD